MLLWSMGNADTSQERTTPILSVSRKRWEDVRVIIVMSLLCVLLRQRENSDVFYYETYFVCVVCHENYTNVCNLTCLKIRTFKGRQYVMEESITGDYALIKVSCRATGDEMGPIYA